MRPVLETLEKQLDEVKAILVNNQAQLASLQGTSQRLAKERDDLVAAINFLKARN